MSRRVKQVEDFWAGLEREDIESLKNCRICPRRCNIDRFDQAGVCRATAVVEVASANLHFGEEPPISAKRGSGTIFLSHCNMFCVYCQNFPISQLGVGEQYSIHELVEEMLSLQSASAHNINFVTPSHYLIQIRRAIIIAKEQGLKIPIVYNTSGYDLAESLKMLDGIVEIYMPDLRYFDSHCAKRFSNAPDYPEVSRNAVLEMYRQVGDLIIDDQGIASRGLLIRLLVLPNNVSGTIETLHWIAENIGTKTYISVMSQYFPAYRAKDIPEISRKIYSNEYIKVLEEIDKLGFERGYIQPAPIYED